MMGEGIDNLLYDYAFVTCDYDIININKQKNSELPLVKNK